MRSVFYRVLIMVIIVLVILISSASAESYPRIANLWGCWPSTTDYDTWARCDLIVTGGGPKPVMERFRKELKKRNPDIIMLGTAQFMNLEPPAQCPWMKDEWYLRRPDGRKVSWWADQVYTPNLFNSDCMNALFQRCEETYGDLIREGLLDGLMCDSVVGRATWLGDVDTNLDGIADKPEDVDARWHDKQCEFFDGLHKRWPGSLILVNDADTDHMPHINGRLFEGATLLDRMIGGTYSPVDAIRTLNSWMTGSAQPGITFALASHPIGWQAWRVGKGDKVTTEGEIDKVKRDYRRMRLGLLTTMMTDAYYYYDVGTIFYGTPKLWYAEYDAQLGKPVSAAKEMAKVPPYVVMDWRAGQRSDLFMKEGASNDSPEGIVADVPDKDSGWSRVIAIDHAKLKMLPGKSYRVQAECEILRKPGNILVFTVRSAADAQGTLDKGMEYYSPQNGDTWKIDATVTLNDLPDYSVQWHMLGAGAFRLKSLRITQVGECYFIREFEHGAAVLNPTQRQITVKLDRPMRKISDKAAPLYYMEIDDTDPNCTFKGAWERMAGEERYSGDGYRRALKIGATASWRITAPSTDVYTISACFPGGKDLTDSAIYTVNGIAKKVSASIDQREGDGGWVSLFNIPLKKGQKAEVALHSSGGGSTAADAIRAESRARFNDGSVVKSLILVPLDGIILLNQ